MEPAPVPVGGPPARDRVWLHILLLVLTFATTTVMGRFHYEGFLIDFVPRPLLFTSNTELWLGGLWYSVPLLAILGAHEMGHYLACRIYGIDATLPFFLPLPPPIGLSGTLGAFIRIRGRITTRPVLFDMAAAGPIAGFVIAVPAMIAGLMMSRVVRLPADFVGLELGEPLLFKAVSFAVFGSIADGWSVNLHPMAMAAWFGLLVTAMNLMPVGQLDGGHISYAVFGRRSSHITLVALAGIVGLAMFAYSWIVWAVLLVVLLRVFGRHHPPTWDEHVPLDRVRLGLALLTLLIFVACFTPTPIQPYELVRPR
jgi:membrane-associated protease RseP (regulator of RpoE activity)